MVQCCAEMKPNLIVSTSIHPNITVTYSSTKLLSTSFNANNTQESFTLSFSNQYILNPKNIYM